MNYIIGIIILAVVVLVVWVVRRQRSLRLRAELMQEAVRNRDFTFRLPTDGLLPGERAMQQALNQLGSTISEQVNQSEVEAWERLTRVLTHEIMNATAPIASISQSLLGRSDVKGTALEEGIRAIHTTSVHLSTFVDSYRKLSQLQEPSLQPVVLSDLVKDVQPLFPQLQWSCNVPPTLTVTADHGMLHQVLVNLAKNATEAGARHIGIGLTDEQPDGKTAISVSNDGQPIPAEARPSIFVPFFTTKRTGTGIGLSLSLRMMIQQGGSLALASRPQTTFILTLKT